MSAQPKVRQALDAEACWKVLARIISEDGIHRADLLAANVPEHTVNALYPASFEYFTKQIMKATEDYGTDHLGKAAIATSKWYRLIGSVRRVQAAIDPGDEIFVREWNLGETPFIGDAVYEALRVDHDLELAVGATNAYSRGIFAAYWLTLHPHLRAQVKDGEAEELVEWVVNRLLPQEILI